MKVKNLSQTPFDEILACFLAAFENYYVKMPTDPDYYRERWKAAKVNWELSYGMFDNEKLVGFIIHGIDTRKGFLTAYNTGTGVLPDYRGRKVTKSIYDFALQDLRAKGIQKTTLEVITENEKAIRAYQGMGFEICATYHCFGGTIQVENREDFEVVERDVREVEGAGLPNQEYYSWDFMPETIREGKYRFFQVVYNQQPESFFVLHPDSHIVAQFDLLQRHEQGWDRLFAAIKKQSPEVRIINVDERIGEKLEQIRKMGLSGTVDQYEMELNLSN